MKKIKNLTLVLSLWSLLSFPLMVSAEVLTSESTSASQQESTNQLSNQTESSSTTSPSSNVENNFTDFSDSSNIPSVIQNEKVLFQKDQAFISISESKLSFYEEVNESIINTLDQTANLLLPLSEKQTTENGTWLKTEFDGKKLWIKSDSQILLNEEITNFTQSDIPDSEGVGQYYSTFEALKEGSSSQMKLDSNVSFISSFKFRGEQIFQILNKNDNSIGYFTDNKKTIDGSSESSTTGFSTTESSKNETESSQQTSESSTTSSSPSTTNKVTKRSSVSVVSTWPTNYSLRFSQGGYGIYNQPLGLPDMTTFGNSSNHLNRVVTVTQAKLLSNGETYYRYNMDNKTYWTIHRAFTEANRPYVTSTWNTNYSLRFYQGGHGIYNQPKGLANTITYGNTSNHINRTVTVTQAKLLSNGETYYRYNMDNKTYWTIHKAFADANKPYVTSTWNTNYSLRFYKGGYAICNQPSGLPDTVTYGNSSNHIRRVVTVTQAKLLSDGNTFYQYSMDNKTYWTNHKAFTDAKNPYIVSTWGTNYAVRIANRNIQIANTPSPLPGSSILGNTSNHINRRVLITQASLLSNGETYYRYSMDNKLYWSLSSAFANRYTSRDILNIASKYIGVTSSPRGSRNNMFNTAFYGIPVSSYTSKYDWCAVFVWYVLREAGLSQEYYGGAQTRWTAPLQNWYKSQNRWSQRPYAGNLIFFSWHDGFTADHVGFIEHVNSDGSLTIIDGNVNDDVQRRTVRYQNNWNVVGFGAINYN
ncbi:GW dipeptide domain-containing protein [Enterococcus devriesei]|uniref:GW dipeptide domain-containing protein n=1 Tax=Enterococcus devriesei TaxID=319970 RepID=UPI002890B4E7|nr:GW dipeptide domain-containing protein [Enterococcus devriesei]MDT2820814.1 GW dipeptide domain-containing protein [Enterococcus devriesei]